MKLMPFMRNLLNVGQELTHEQKVSASKEKSQKQGLTLPPHAKQSSEHNLLRFKKIFKKDSGSNTGRTEQTGTRRLSTGSQLNADFDALKERTIERLDSCLKFDWDGFAKRNPDYQEHATQMHARLEEVADTFKHVITMKVTAKRGEIAQELIRMRPEAEQEAKLQTSKPMKERFRIGSREERLNERKSIVQGKLHKAGKALQADFDKKMEKVFEELEGSYRNSISEKFNMYFNDTFRPGEVPQEMTGLKEEIMRLAKGVASQPNSEQVSIASQKNSSEGSRRNSAASSVDVWFDAPENEVVDVKSINSGQSKEQIAPETSGPRRFGREYLDKSLAESWRSPHLPKPTDDEIDKTLAAFAKDGTLKDIKLDPHIEHFLRTGELPELGTNGEWMLKKTGPSHKPENEE